MTVEFAFGDTKGESNGTLATGLPLLSGDSREYIERSVEPVGTQSGIMLWGGGDHLVGFARSDPAVPIEEATRRIYEGLLACSRGFNLFRIWNLVPRINEESPDGLENYRAFCKGRSVAFEDALGMGFTSRLPAASALGTADSGLTIAFLAGRAETTHFENPVQTPAYEYPAEHGPRPPSFARATTVVAHGRLDAFISGTSAVVGHETFAPNDTARQLDCTFENLKLISAACGLGPNIGAGHGVARHFKVYLRSASDLGLVAPRMERAILRPGDRVTYLGADICRAALNVEIEVSVRGAARI